MMIMNTDVVDYANEEDKDKDELHIYMIMIIKIDYGDECYWQWPDNRPVARGCAGVRCTPQICQKFHF